MQLDLPDELDHLSRDVRTAIFLIVQESLTNVQRHSGSRKAEISLQRSGPQIELQVRD